MGHQGQDRSASGTLPFRIHWEHRRKGKRTWYLCAAPPEVIKPSEGTCDVTESVRHRVAHRQEICECGLVTYEEATQAAESARAAKLSVQMSSRVRRRIPVEMKRAVRLHAQDRCEDCGLPLVSEQDVKAGGIWHDTVSFPVYDDYPCHRCGFRFPVVDAGELKDRSLGARIQEQFPAFYEDYSSMVRDSYWMNHCPKCGAKQGAFYVGSENTFDLEPSRRIAFPVAPSWEPEEVVARIREEWGHVHHKDGNPANNTPSNLALLCVPCHRARHERDSSRHPSPPE